MRGHLWSSACRLSVLLVEFNEEEEIKKTDYAIQNKHRGCCLISKKVKWQ